MPDPLPPGIEYYVDVVDPAWAAYCQAPVPPLSALFETIVSKAQPNVYPLAVTLRFTNDTEMRMLNHQYRGLDKATNVLSFDYQATLPEDEAVPHEGDIVLAYETIAREAAEKGISLAQHSTHMITHGTLHLLGYDHETEAEAEVMETLETKILAEHAIPCPYSDT